MGFADCIGKAWLAFFLNSAFLCLPGWIGQHGLFTFSSVVPLRTFHFLRFPLRWLVACSSRVRARQRERLFPFSVYFNSPLPTLNLCLCSSASFAEDGQRLLHLSGHPGRGDMVSRLYLSLCLMSSLRRCGWTGPCVDVFRRDGGRLKFG